MSDHEFVNDMTDVGAIEAQLSSQDSKISQAVAELQAMQPEPAVVAKGMRIEPRGKGKKVNIHIYGNGFGDEVGRVVMAASPARPMNIQKWHNKKIVIKGEPNTVYTEMIIYKKDGTIASIVNLPKVFNTGEGVVLGPQWTLTETEALEDGIHFRGTAMDMISSVFLQDDTFPAEEFVGQIVSQTATELVVAYPAGQNSPLERALLCASGGIVCQEVVANSWDVNKDALSWPGGWTKPAVITGWFSSREASGDVIITFLGEALGDDPGTVDLTFNPTVRATNRTWSNTLVEVDADPDTVYTDFVVKTFFGQTVPERGVIGKPIRTPAALGTISTMSSGAINTITLTGTGFAPLAYVDLNSPSAGAFRVYNPAVYPGGSGLNGSNGFTVTWTDTSVVILSTNLGGNSFNGAEFFDLSDTQNVLISVPTFTVAAAPAVPTITSYALAGANGEILVINGANFNDWDLVSLSYNVRRKSDDLVALGGAISARRPGSPADPLTVSHPTVNLKYTRRNQLMDNTKSWSDTKIELYIDAGSAPETNFYTSDFRVRAYTSTTWSAGHTQVHDEMVPNGPDMKDNPAGRGAVPEFLNATLRDVGRGLGQTGQLTWHEFYVTTINNRIVFELVDTGVDPDRDVDGLDIGMFIAQVGGGYVVYNEAADLHDWDGLTPAQLNAEQGITVIEWTSSKIEVEVPNVGSVGQLAQAYGFRTAGGALTFLTVVADLVGPRPAEVTAVELIDAGKVIKLTGTDLLQWDAAQFRGAIKRRSDNATVTTYSQFTFRPGSNGEKSTAPPVEKANWRSQLGDRLKSWSDTEIQIYADLNGSQASGSGANYDPALHYTSDFILDGVKYSGPNAAGFSYVWRKLVPNGPLMTDPIAGRGLVPEVLGTNVAADYSIVSKLQAGFNLAGGHVASANRSTNKLLITLNNTVGYANKVDAGDLAFFGVIMIGTQWGTSNTALPVYNPNLDLHAWDGLSTADLNALNGVVVDSWAGNTIQVDIADLTPAATNVSLRNVRTVNGIEGSFSGGVTITV